MGCVVGTPASAIATPGSQGQQGHGEYPTGTSRAPSHAEKSPTLPLPNASPQTLSGFALDRGSGSERRCSTEAETTLPHPIAAARRHPSHKLHVTYSSGQLSHATDTATPKHERGGEGTAATPMATITAPFNGDPSLPASAAASSASYAARHSKLSLHGSPFPSSPNKQRVFSLGSGPFSSSVGARRALSSSSGPPAQSTSNVASGSSSSGGGGGGGGKAGTGVRAQLPQYNLSSSQQQLSHRRPSSAVSGSNNNNNHAMRESLLSDISVTLSTISGAAGSAAELVSPNHGNSMGARNSIKTGLFRNGEDLEAQRQHAPLSIEEDLFIYDDIVISKDEARTKHWRLAGRKPPVALEASSSSDSAPGGAPSGRSGSLKGKSTFSFNDFDVCVDEMDWMPTNTGAASSIAPLQKNIDVSAASSSSAATDSRSITATSTVPTLPNTVAHFEAQARLTAAKANRPLRGFETRAMLGHATRVKCIALSPAETDFASCSNEDASISLNNFGVRSEVGIFTGHQDTIINATFSPDGKYLATTSKDKTMILWDVMTTKNLLTFTHPKVVICCSFGPDSKYLVSGCQDRICRLWDTKRGKEWLSYTGHEGIIIAIAFSPDGSYVCSASADKTLRVWSATTAKTRFQLTRHTGIILSCSYTADGRHIISNDESLLCVWSTEDGSCTLAVSPAEVAGAMLLSARGPKLGWTLSSAAPGAFTGYVLVACNNRFVYVLDIETGKEVTSAFCKAPVYCLTAGSTEKMACGDSFGNIYVLQLK